MCDRGSDSQDVSQMLSFVMFEEYLYISLLTCLISAKSVTN